ncbi:hypothetical protein ABPG74_006155 [Tetrahymena malaccensis]
MNKQKHKQKEYIQKQANKQAHTKKAAIKSLSKDQSNKNTLNSFLQKMYHKLLFDEFINSSSFELGIFFKHYLTQFKCFCWQARSSKQIVQDLLICCYSILSGTRCSSQQQDQLLEYLTAFEKSAFPKKL